MRQLLDGLRLALTMLTVTPLPAPNKAKPPEVPTARAEPAEPGGGPVAWVSRPVVGWAMTLAPIVGALLGLVAGGVSLGLRELGTPPLLAGAVAVGVLALLTRGLHLDGLADTVDGLGSYRYPEKALLIMKSPGIGAFGVVALVLVLLIQSTGFAQVSVVGAVVAVMTGRLAITLACRRGILPARPDGLGALVAGTVTRPGVIVTSALTVSVAWFAFPGRPWQGPLTVIAALIVAEALSRHIRHRLGGITGDVLGFLSETATTIVLIGLLLGSPPA